MKSKFLSLLVLGLAFGAIVAFYALNGYIYNEKQAYTASDFKDAEYVIEGARVRLTDGIASTSEAVTRYFGNELMADIDGDGREDVVFLVTQERGGSGRFYYVVAALNTERGYLGSEGYFIGDRIAPQTTEQGMKTASSDRSRVVIVNYAERAPGEPFTTSPSVGTSVRLLLDPQTRQWGIVEQDFEGEADPARMSLTMKSWTWISATYSDGKEVRPRAAAEKAFVLTFSPDGKFTAKTDCNHMGGSYSHDPAPPAIAFSNIFSTEMYCEGSQEGDFAKMLDQIQSYHFTSRGELVFDFKYDSGSAVFK